MSESKQEIKSLDFYGQRQTALVTDLRTKEIALRTELGTRLPDSDLNKIQKIEEVLAILNKNVEGDTPHNAVSEYQQQFKILEALHDGLAPKKTAKVTDTLFGSARESIKRILGVSGFKSFFSGKHSHFRKLDDLMQDYVQAQVEIVAHKIAYKRACQQQEEIRAMQAKFPGAQVDMLVLKRHEVCTGGKKFIGANPNSGLNALSSNPLIGRIQRALGKQSQFDLKMIQSVQTQNTLYLKEMGLVDRVETYVSPVKRAEQTHEFASPRHEVVDLTVFNGALVEKSKWPSGHAQTKPSVLSEVYRARIRANTDRVKFQNDVLIGSESREELNERLGTVHKDVIQAFQKKETQPGTGSACGTLRIVVGHGAMDREILKFIKEHYKEVFDGVDFSRNPEITLDFGEQHNLLIARDTEGKILGVRFTGITTHYGEKPNMESSEELHRKIDNKVDLERALFAYCLQESDEEKVTTMIRKHANTMLENIDLFDTDDVDNLDRVHLIVNVLYQEARKEAIQASEQPPPSTFLSIKFRLHQYTQRANPEEKLDFWNKIGNETEILADGAKIQELLDTTGYKPDNAIKILEVVLALKRAETRDILAENSVSSQKDAYGDSPRGSLKAP